MTTFNLAHVHFHMHILQLAGKSDEKKMFNIELELYRSA